MRAQTAADYDVAILGTGLVGTVLGAILARHGVKTAMFESAVHPRFAIGESVVPATGTFLRILSDRFDVPELRHLSSFYRVRRHVTSACGVKRSFTFVQHQPGEMPPPNNATQVLTAKPPFGPDSHFFRQDVDAYMLAVALRHGARIFQATRITDLTRTESGWQLKTHRGLDCHARYIVDGTGARSLLAERFALRETPTTLETHSRSIFTHLIGVPPYETSRGSARPQVPSPPSHGTLHHLFPGGWVWVIPFNNHHGSTNPLCSVGLQLDSQWGARQAEDPEQELRAIVGRFPGIAAHLEAAVAVRDWVATDRLQYSARRAAGEGFFLLPHAAGFVDPLYSSGLATSFATVHSLAWRLIEAVRQDDYSPERFAYVERWLLHDLEYVDQMVAGSYTAFRSFDLWNAWFRVFTIGALLWNFGLTRVHLEFLRRGDPGVLALIEQPPHRGALASDFPPNRELFTAAKREIDAVQRGMRGPEAAAAAIFELIADAPFVPPVLRLADPRVRHVSVFNVPTMLELFRWGRHEAPRAVNEHYFEINLKSVMSELVVERWDEARRVLRAASELLSLSRAA